MKRSRGSETKCARAAVFSGLFIGFSILSTSAFAGVVPGDTFTFDIAGFNSSTGVGYILGPDQSAVFGGTTTFTGAGYNGQDITISSSEMVNGDGTATDTFVISTPTNFLTSSSVNGTKITALQFDIGDANSGLTFNGVPDTVDFTSSVTSPTSSGSILYGTANTSFTLTPALTQSNSGLSLAAVEGVNTGTTAISTIGVHEFELAFTYATASVSAAPEPSAWALMLLGVGGIGFAFRQAKKETGPGRTVFA